ncbi:MAG TPA: cupredoxin family copper-binding protein [Acetobacteraceae bacterium]|nr:cupredoxin family copper-binding protein [Acetobacteraceae bacterium]
MIRRILLAFALLLSAALIPVAAADRDAAVTIDNFTFLPAQLTVAVGTRVTWTNRDDIPHTVRNDAAPPAFRSPPLDTGDHYAYTFRRPGTYRYFCSLHPHMQGVVIVR